jgi:hypothetical protein
MINDVLDTSKIEAGKIEVLAEDIDIGRFIDEVMVTAELLMAKNDNQLEVVRCEAPGTAHQDLTKLRQSLLNPNRWTGRGCCKPWNTIGARTTPLRSWWWRMTSTAVECWLAR